MTIFDLVAGLILLASAMIGFARGAVRELIGFFSFLLAALAAIWLLPFATPLMSRFLQAHWMAVAAAIIVVFVLTYVALRLIGNAMTAGLQRTGLGGANQVGGLIVGVLRGLLTLGIAAIVVGLLPPSLQPGWILSAKLWPLSRASGQVVAKLIPKTGDMTGGLGAKLKNAFDQTGDENDAPEFATPPASDHHTHHTRHTGYGDRDREQLDSLVNRSR